MYDIIFIIYFGNGDGVIVNLLSVYQLHFI